MASRLGTIAGAAGAGAVAGLVGGAVMAVGEKLEQAVTHRPNSYVPARALLTLVGRTVTDKDKPVLWNHVMHYSTAALLGALRGVWSVTGIRGSYANAWHTTVRLAFDQTIENATGAGAPPHSWPTSERIVDVTHKAVFSVVTGVLVDRLKPPVLVSTRGRKSH